MAFIFVIVSATPSEPIWLAGGFHTGVPSGASVSWVDPGTLKVYVAIISACHNQIKGISVGKHVLVSHFLCGAKQLRLICKTTGSILGSFCGTWRVVYCSLQTSWVSICEAASLEVAFLIAITSLKRVGDLQPLSVASSCLYFAPGLVKMILHPRPDCLPKVPFTVSSCCSSGLLSFAIWN